MKLVFMGTPDFAAIQLEKLIDAGHKIALVISQPDAAKDRGKKVKPTAVKEVALDHGIEVLQPGNVNGADVIERLQKIAPDAIIVAAYGRLLSKEILDLPRLGCLNVHASLLPKYRGAAPMQHAILNGDEVTGVTIMRMASGMDTGDMISKVEVPIGRMNLEQLHDELATRGARLLCETLAMPEEKIVNGEKQDGALATFAPMLKKKDGEIDFGQTAEKIERKVRAFYPWPGTFTYLDGEIFKVWEADVVAKNTENAPGTVSAADERGIYVQTKDGMLVLKTVQAPGKKRMSAADYMKGNKIEILKVLG